MGVEAIDRWHFDARTSLLLPFSLPDDSTPAQWQEAMRNRTLPPRRAAPEELGCLMWMIQKDRPKELSELHQAFQIAIWNAPWLSLQESVRARFSEMWVSSGNRKKPVWRKARIEGAHAILLAPGAGVAVIEVSYPNCEGPSEFLQRLYGLRHIEGDDRVHGVVFPGPNADEALGRVEHDSTRPEYLRALGPHLAPASYEGVAKGESLAPVSLSTFVNWLLLLPGENPERADIHEHRSLIEHRESLPNQAKVAVSRYGKHHTVLILDEAPDDVTLARLSFLARRGYKEDYATPFPDTSGDEHLIPRSNRRIAISREGSCSISWPSARLNKDFETKQWPAKFMGIYQLLAVYVLSEKQGLIGRAADLARFSDELLVPMDDETTRRPLMRKLDRLVLKTVRQILLLAGDDCGGLSEYCSFYSTFRRVHYVDELLRELRRELTELHNVLHSAHQNERERIARQEANTLNKLQTLTWLLTLFLAPFAVFQGLAALFPAEGMTPAIRITILILAPLLIFMLVWFLLRRRSPPFGSHNTLPR